MSGVYIGALAGIIYGLYSQISLIKNKDSLYELVADQCFLDIIKSDNQIHARSWLNICYKNHATAKDNMGKIALMHAAIHGAYNVAQELLVVGADVHAQDCQGKTALDYALENNNQGMIKLLTR